MALLLHWLLSAVSLLITAKIIPGFRVATFGSALWAAALIGFANITIRPILLFLTFPINIVTFGLFTFVVNAMVLKMCAALIGGFEIRGWGSAILGAFVLALMSAVFGFWFFQPTYETI